MDEYSQPQDVNIRDLQNFISDLRKNRPLLNAFNDAKNEYREAKKRIEDNRIPTPLEKLTPEILAAYERDLDPESSVSAARTAYRQPDPVVWTDAPLATQFGMDAATAYQEALAGSAHQREVADLRAAGLNPVLSASRSGSDVFSGTVYVPAGSAGSAKATNDDLENTKKGVVKITKGMVEMFAPRAAKGVADIVDGVADIFG